VFGGGIGENSPAVRRRIAGGLQWAGIEMDTGTNGASIGIEATISTPDSHAAVLAVPVDEASVIAGEAAGFLTR
jgi:acetate kinase